MSLSPPKFIKAMRARDREGLVAVLQALADRWEELAANGANTGSDWGPDVLFACAQELRDTLERGV